MQNGLNRILLAASILILSAAFAATSLQFRSSYEPVYLWVEAESAAYIEHPVEKTSHDEGVSGGQAIQIKQGAGGGVLGEAGGKALYTVNITRAGYYGLWARVKWSDGCGNSFFVSIGDERKTFLIGQDGVYDRWHWIRQPKLYSLGEGRLQIIFKNAEDGVYLDKFLLTNNLDYTPEGIDQGGFQSYFSGGSGANWVPSTPDRWTVQKDPASQTSAYVLSPSKLPLEEKILSSDPVAGSGFAIMARMKIDQEDPSRRNCRVILNFQDSDNFYYVDLNAKACRIVKRRNGIDVSLAETSNPNILNDTDYHDIFVKRTSNSIVIKHDQTEILSTKDSAIDEGYVGVGSNFGGLYIESIRYTNLESIYFASNFYILDDLSSYDDKWRSESGLWWRSQLLVPSYPYGVRAESEAISTTGESYWRNYSLRAAAKSATNAGFGLCFYYRNRNNHYLMRTAAGESPKSYADKLQLLKVSGGEKSIMAEAPVNILRDQWYDLKVEIIDQEIRAFIDNENLLTLRDSTLTEGRIGLYADPTPYSRELQSKIKLLRGGNMDGVKIQLPTEPESDGMGIAFLYHDSDNYHLFKWSVDPNNAKSNSRTQLIQVKNGEEILVAERISQPYTIGKPYYFEFLARMGKLITSIENQMIFDANLADTRLGRVGVYIGRRQEDAYFDDVEVQSINTFSISQKYPLVEQQDEGAEASLYNYRFRKPGSASRDLSAWLISSGAWDACKMFQSLVGQKESATDAVLWHKYPTLDNITLNTAIRIDSISKPYLIICGNASDVNHGYRFSLKLDEYDLLCTLQRNGKTVSSEKLELKKIEDWIPISIRKKENSIQMIIKENLVIDYQDDSPIRGNRVGAGVGGDLYAAVYFQYFTIQ